nr:PREDICTED: lysosomal protein NCU-G1 [Struthio camelus australis]
MSHGRERNEVRVQLATSVQLCLHPDQPAKTLVAGPKREDGIRCRPRSLQAANWTLPASSVVRAYFGEGLGSAYTVSAINISFGGEDGEVYQEKRYLSWSALLGFGQPPKDTFSLLVISIMAVALGTPVVLLLVGAVVVLFAQRKRYSEYEPIN